VTALPLKFIGGHPALDLVNTVDWTGAGLAAERLPDYGRWLEWAERREVLGTAEARRLRTSARRNPAAAGQALEQVHATRRLLHRVLGGRAHDRPPSSGDLRALNALLRQALARLELVPAGAGAALGWPHTGRGLDGPLWPVVWSAARLLESEDAARIRICHGVDCGWMYLDRSRNGLRRWCEMSTCGTREKNRRRAIAT
jgi:predicted RNA-binding Zn ribbon-like protein